MLYGHMESPPYRVRFPGKDFAWFREMLSSRNLGESVWLEGEARFGGIWAPVCFNLAFIVYVAEAG